MTDDFRLAREAAGDARTLFALKSYNGACNRAYYAMFRLARAMLESRGYVEEAAKTHASVLRLFSLEFVRNGLWIRNWDERCRVPGQPVTWPTMPQVSPRPEAEAVMASLEAFMRAAESILGGVPDQRGVER